ncbi:MAG: type IV toxin-antitoxin system AbiEi family antitoxin domain-containing protein [Solirubrobacteraceae bacterium]
MRGLFATAALIAGRQHGRVTRAQLLVAGVDAKRIERWLADGRLRRVHVGVYALGHLAPSPDANCMAAVLASGSGAVLSHAPAEHLLQLRHSDPPPAEVTVPTAAHRRRPAIVIHRVHELPAGDTSTLRGIPITTVARTLLDLAPRRSPTELARACHEAWVRYSVGPRQIEACIARNPTRRGAAKLRRAIGADVTLSILEDRFVKLLRDHGLPRARTNIDHHGDKVDCRWPLHNLTVELLSFRYHATRHAFERDLARRRRSNHLAFSYDAVFERGPQTIAELAELISGPSGTCAGAGSTTVI